MSTGADEAPDPRGPGEPVAIGLGSNLGERRAQLERAVASIRAVPGLVVERVSEWIETAPVGGPPGQGAYRNGALVARARLAPRALLAALAAIEAEGGRVREAGVANGPRTIDLDLLVFGARELALPGLVVPHPRMRLRRFVLEPLASIAPDLRVPPDGARVAELLERLARSERREAGRRGSAVGGAQSEAQSEARSGGR